MGNIYYVVGIVIVLIAKSVHLGKLNGRNFKIKKRVALLLKFHEVTNLADFEKYQTN